MLFVHTWYDEYSQIIYFISIFFKYIISYLSLFILRIVYGVVIV